MHGTRHTRTGKTWNLASMEPGMRGTQRNWNPVSMEPGKHGTWQACNPAHKNPVSMEPCVHWTLHTWSQAYMEFITHGIQWVTPMSMEFTTYGIQNNCSSKLVSVEPCITSGLTCTDKWICYSFLDNLVISIYSFYTNNIYWRHTYTYNNPACIGF